MPRAQGGVSKMSFFCTNNGAKAKYIQFAVMYDHKKQEILIPVSLEPADIWQLSLKNDFSS